MNGKRILQMLLVVLVTALVPAGCATTPRKAQFLVPDFAQADIRTIFMPPVSYEAGYGPPDGVDLDKEIHREFTMELKKKGYRVTQAPGGETGEATLQIHVDFLFMSQNLDDVSPPPMIRIHAQGSLASAKGGKELWRDEGEGQVGGMGGMRINYLTESRLLAISILASQLLDTLPNVAGR